MTSKSAKYILQLIILLFSLFLFSEPAAAESYTPEVNYSTYSAYKAEEEMAVKSPDESSIIGVYVVFRDNPSSLTVKSGGGGFRWEVTQDEYLQVYIPVSEKLGDIAELEVIPEHDCNICGVYAVTENQIKDAGGELPPWVHNWDAPAEKADLMLISCHADDEQLFFAGILPYYSGVKGLDVQVVYFTDHYDAPGRHQERLNGLWTVGVRHYPVSIHLNDAWADNYGQALNNAEAAGYTEEILIDRLRSAICRFQPKVVVSHDENGEYKHGQHIFLTALLERALKDENWVTENAGYLNRVFLHLYKTNPVRLSFLDTAFEELSGKTPFQTTQNGFLCHKSQLWTWFNGWIFGKNGEITRADQIKTYSPLNYGMYIGSDGDYAEAAGAGDFFSGLTSYAEDRAAEEEEKRLAAEEAEREARQQEEERIAMEAAAIAEKKKQTIIIGTAAAVFTGILLIDLWIINKRRRNRRR